MFLAAIAFGALFMLPFLTSAVQSEGIFSDQRFSVQDHLALQIITIAGAVLALVCIFLFKNRKSQVRLSYVVILICLGVMAAAYLIFTGAGQTLASPSVNPATGVVMPVLGLACVALAVYFIRKDDRLVKSMDRLR